MKQIHLPAVNARYWAGITLASVFGTNLGDFYAHESGLGLGRGLLVLAVLAGICFLIERRNSDPTKLGIGSLSSLSERGPPTSPITSRFA